MVSRERRKGRRCAYCGARDVPLQLDHIVARSNHGSDRVRNFFPKRTPKNPLAGCPMRWGKHARAAAFEGHTTCADKSCGAWETAALCHRQVWLSHQTCASGVCSVKFLGFQTGDIVRAQIPLGKYWGVHVGWVTITFGPLHPHFLRPTNIPLYNFGRDQ